MVGIQSEDGAALLDSIDKLRSLKIVSQEVSLPQIVVVGSQSSGKSSVLEAISGFKFPVRSVFCTSFATEVILRRSTQSSRRIGIISRSGDQNRDAIRAFERRWEQNTSTTEVDDTSEQALLNTFIEEAKKLMTFPPKSKFSEDALRIELSGPDKDHLSLIDLPGIIATTKKDQRKEDVELVKQLVKTNAASKRSIILVIIPGKDDFENQEVLELLKEIDGWEKRTLGIITHPDQVKVLGGPDKEEMFQDLAENNAVPLELGWHVLRNPSWEEREQENFNRDETEEEFFRSQGFWSSLKPSQRGVTHLKERLGRLLVKHISRELPEMLRSIEAVITECETELKALGSPRCEYSEQRRYLENITHDFALYTRAAVRADWGYRFFNDHTHRLRAMIRIANDAFAKAMMDYGHKWQITPTETKQPRGAQVDAPRYLRCSQPEYISAQAFILNVTRDSKSHRGLELPGQEIAGLAPDLFRDQASKWRAIARNHIEHVFNLVRIFFNQYLLPEIAGPDTSKILLKAIVNPALEGRRKLLLGKLDEIIQPYENYHLQTLNMAFNDLLFARDAAEAEERSRLMQSGDESTLRVMHERDQLIQSQLMQVHVEGCDRTVAFMRSYYENALNVFKENVAILAIEQCLLHDLDKIISSGMISERSAKEIDSLASESPATLKARERLESRLAEYQRARDTILPHCVVDDFGSHVENYRPQPNEDFVSEQNTPAYPNIAVSLAEESDPSGSNLPSTPRRRTPSDHPAAKAKGKSSIRADPPTPAMSTGAATPDHSFAPDLKYLRDNTTPAATDEYAASQNGTSQSPSPPQSRHSRTPSRNSNSATLAHVNADEASIPPPKSPLSRASRKLSAAKARSPSASVDLGVARQSSLANADGEDL